MEFLSAKHTYLNERLALLYGINDVKGDRFQRVELKDSARWGLLGKGAILMAAAYPNRTSPVLRGAFILEYISGTPPTAPPPEVPPFPENDVGSAKKLTIREITAKHRANPTCFACHGVMDPLGFALENFDAVGVWRRPGSLRRRRSDRLGRGAAGRNGDLGARTICATRCSRSRSSSCRRSRSGS